VATLAGCARDVDVTLPTWSTWMALLVAACTTHAPPAPSTPPASSAIPPHEPGATAIALPAPGATPIAVPGVIGPASIDYIGYEPRGNRIWVPVGNTGSVDVFDIATARFDRVDGFKSVERDTRGRKRIIGPSAVSIGEGIAYVGNRATSEVCAVDTKSLKLGQCLALAQATDGVEYVASTKEVWVTTPRDHSLTVLDASDPRLLKPKIVVKLEGESEGYGVDEIRGRFFTNLEDTDRTVVVNLKTHRVESIWKPGCGEAGPRGLTVDAVRDFVFVACTDHVQILDAGHGGALLGKLDTGAGVDNIDYLAEKALLYVAAGRAARLTIARVDDQGHFAVVATAATSDGARSVVADAQGNAYVADPGNARLLVFPLVPPKN